MRKRFSVTSNTDRITAKRRPISSQPSTRDSAKKTKQSNSWKRRTTRDPSRSHGTSKLTRALIISAPTRVSRRCRGEFASPETPAPSRAGISGSHALSRKAKPPSRETLLLQRGADLVLVDLAALHHERHMLQHFDPIQRILGHRNQVRVLARLQRALILRAIDQVRRR